MRMPPRTQYSATAPRTARQAMWSDSISLQLTQRVPEAQRGTRVGALAPGAVREVVRKALPVGIRILRHAMERKRLHGLRECGVEITVLGPAIHEQQKIAFPTWRGGRESGPAQAQLVTRAHDHH